MLKYQYNGIKIARRIKLDKSDEFSSITEKIRLLTSVLLKEAISHILDNQWYIWWDKAGGFLGPRRVRNGPIALHKMSTVK